ncbi:MAG: hypothetical protein AAGG08_13095 [Actinomycetota bacterium]
MSEWVVHFTPSPSALGAILAEREIRASGPFGWARSISQVRQAHMSACLSEIPLDHLARLTERRGLWGIGFTKSYVASVGGARVWYLEEGVGPGKDLFDSIGTLLRAQNFNDPLWRLTPFIDPLADGEPFSYRFDWEREWRVVGGLRFEPDDVAFVVTPDGASAAWVGLDRWSEPPPILASVSRSAFVASVVQTMWDDYDAAVQSFLTEFTDPAEVLPYETAEGGYQWLVPEWDTEEAAEVVFEDEVPGELLEVLNGMSVSWVNLREWELFVRDE